MQIERTAIPDVLLFRPRVVTDERGYFLESWNERVFAEAGLGVRFVQDNHSRSARHVLRGLHYQREQAQGKLVRVVSGMIRDVVVDLRGSSPSFGRWLAFELSADNFLELWVPPGFAHGILALSESVDVLYRCTDFYAPQFERTIRWDDADLAIDWRLPPNVAPLVSPKDQQGVRFRDADTFP
ncbi:MAG: dTDP-4-dehydrorhamnose 3,5-epimerase [Steroidobacterales bacterium]